MEEELPGLHKAKSILRKMAEISKRDILNLPYGDPTYKLDLAYATARGQLEAIEAAINNIDRLANRGRDKFDPPLLSETDEFMKEVLKDD